MRRGFALAHGGSLGTSFAVFRSPVALAPDASGCLGGVGAHGASPSLAIAGDRLAVAFVEDGRPMLYLDGAPPGGLVALEGEAHAVAVDFDGATALVVAADRDGLYAVRVSTAPVVTASPAVRWVSRGDVRAPLRVHRVGDARFVFYALSDAALGVLSVAPGGAVRDVRYALPAPCAHLGAASGSRRAAIALAYDGETVDRALFDAQGRAVERPHVALRVPGARFVSAQAVWAARRFVAAGVDAADGTCWLDGAEGERATSLAGFGPGPLALAHVRDQWIGLQLATDGARLGLAIRTIAPGNQGEGGVRWFSPEGAERREARRRSAELLRAVHGELARASYRDPGSIEVDAEALTLRVGDGASALALRFAPEPEALAIELELEDPSYEDSLADRFARFVTGEVRGAERWEAWGRELADGVLEVAAIGVAAEEGRRIVRLGLAGFPTGAAVSEVLRRARERKRTEG